MFYLYILRSGKDEKLYIGITHDIESRLSAHNSGWVRSTRSRRPFKVVYLKQYSTRQEAAREEWLLKHTPGAGKRKHAVIKEYQQNTEP